MQLLNVFKLWNVLLEVLDAFINGGFVTRKSDLRGNFLFLLLSAFGMVIVSAFTGTFMGFLAVLGEPRQIQTLEEAVSQVTKVCSHPTFKLFKAYVDKSDVLWKLFEKYETCSSTEGNLDWYELSSRPQEPGPAFLMNEYRQAWCLNSPLLWDESTKTSFAHVVPECVLTPTFVSFMARMKDGPKQRLNAILLGIVEAGIYAKIESKAWWYMRSMEWVHRGPALSKAFPTVFPAPVSAPSPLTLSALVEPAVVLGVGTLAAAVAFLVEVALRMRANGCCKPGARQLCCQCTASK